MKTLKQLLKNMLVKLKWSIELFIMQGKTKTGKLSSNNKVILKHLKILRQILIIAKKIVNQVLIDIADPD